MSKCLQTTALACCLALVAMIAAGCGRAPGSASISADACPAAERVNGDRYVDGDGHAVYYCCGDCPEDMLRDPERYMKKAKAAAPAACPPAGAGLHAK